jgi:hypothetical protein
MEEGKKVEVGPAGRPAIPLLMELGALTLGAEVFSPNTRTVLLTEDQDTEPVKVFARANGARDFACLSYNGCNNLMGARHLARLITELRPDVKIVIHRDRDFRTNQEISFEKLLFDNWLQYEKGERISELFTPFNDIEHSFIQPAHLADVLSEKIDIGEVEKIMVEVIALKRDDLTNAIRVARGVHERDIYKAERMKKKTALRAQAGIGENAPREKDFLPENGTIPLHLDQCHGKMAYKAFAHALHGKLGGDRKAIDPLIVSESPHLRAVEWQAAFIA